MNDDRSWLDPAPGLIGIDDNTGLTSHFEDAISGLETTGGYCRLIMTAERSSIDSCVPTADLSADDSLDSTQLYDIRHHVSVSGSDQRFESSIAPRRSILSSDSSLTSSYSSDSLGRPVEAAARAEHGVFRGDLPDQNQQAQAWATYRNTETVDSPKSDTSTHGTSHFNTSQRDTSIHGAAQLNNLRPNIPHHNPSIHGSSRLHAAATDVEIPSHVDADILGALGSLTSLQHQTASSVPTSANHWPLQSGPLQIYSTARQHALLEGQSPFPYIEQMYSQQPLGPYYTSGPDSYPSSYPSSYPAPTATMYTNQGEVGSENCKHNDEIYDDRLDGQGMRADHISVPVDHPVDHARAESYSNLHALGNAPHIQYSTVAQYVPPSAALTISRPEYDPSQRVFAPVNFRQDQMVHPALMQPTFVQPSDAAMYHDEDVSQACPYVPQQSSGGQAPAVGRQQGRASAKRNRSLTGINVRVVGAPEKSQNFEKSNPDESEQNPPTPDVEMPPEYRVLDLEAARDLVFPRQYGFNYAAANGEPDDVDEVEDSGELWIIRWMNAINHIYNREFAETLFGENYKNNDDHKFYRAQFAQYAEKKSLNVDQPLYSADMCNARLRLLWQTCINFHRGGESLYPLTGDKKGYLPDHSLSCSQRMEAIEQLFKLNKRVVIDLFEGRGTSGLVANPLQYNKRKFQNHKSNKKKKAIILNATKPSSSDDTGKATSQVAIGNSSKKKKPSKTSVVQKSDKTSTQEETSTESAPTDGDPGPSTKKQRK